MENYSITTKSNNPSLVFCVPFLLGALIFSNDLNARVWGNDDRVFFPKLIPQGWEPFFDQIGIIYNESTGASEYAEGTGFVLGTNCDVVVTSAHVVFTRKAVFNKNDNKIPIKSRTPFENFNSDGKLTIYTKNSYDSPYDGIRHKLKNVKNGFDVFKSNHPLSNDWAIAKTSSPVLSCYPYKLDEDGICSGDLYIVGYNKENHKKIVSKCKPIKQTTTGTWSLPHCCDTDKSSSGSPIFCFEDGEFKLMAIQDGSRTRQSGYVKPTNFGDSANLQCVPGQNFNRGARISGKFKSSLLKELESSKQRYEKSIKK